MLDPRRGKRPVKIDTRGTRQLLYGEHHIDLVQVEQLIDLGQTHSIGLMIYYYAQHRAQDCDSMMTALWQALNEVEQQGLDILSEYKTGNLALPRLFELAAAINRIRRGEQN
jgi:uncharacterized membrane protein YhfC